jgi:hypothetical protein
MDAALPRPVVAAAGRSVVHRQSRWASLFEVTLNVGTGFIAAMAVWQFVVPQFYPHLAPTLEENLYMTCVFTGVSVLRGYLWRRFFTNNYHSWVMRRLNRRVLQWKDS